MGKIVQGILGGFSGKVGTVIGSIWKGIATMRAIAASISNPRTAAQLEQRARFKTVIRFLKPLTAFLRVSFRGLAIKKTAFNAAMAYNLQEAVSGAYPNFTIDYTKALVSCGSLTGVLDGAAVSNLAGKVDFTWDDNSGNGDAMETDKVLLVAYNPLRNQAVTLTGGKTRGEAADSLIVPDTFTGESVECFIGFIKADGSMTSNSQWVGSVQVV